MMLGWYFDSTVLMLAIDICIARDVTIPTVAAAVCVWLNALLYVGLIAFGAEWDRRLGLRHG